MPLSGVLGSHRIASETQKAAEASEERTLIAMRQLAFQNSSMATITDEVCRFRHKFWRSEDENGSTWRYTKLDWQGIPGLPTAMAKEYVHDQFGDLRQYENLLTVSRARICIFVTRTTEGEPTAVFIFDSQVEDSRLFGIQRHLTWARTECLSPAIVTTDAGLFSEIHADGKGDRLSTENMKLLDEAWAKGYRVKLNTPTGWA